MMLSERLRPDVECAPWVIDEVKSLEAELSKARAREKEYIICSAIWFDDGKEYPHQPLNTKTGVVICGMRHHNCFMAIQLIKEIHGIKDAEGKKHAFPGFVETQGFLTSENRFVDRVEGRDIAVEAEQIIDKSRLRGNILFSEDVF